MKVSSSRSILFLGSQMRMGGAQRALFRLADWFHAHRYRVVVAFFYDKDQLHEAWQSQTAYPVLNLNAWKNDQVGLKTVGNLLLGLQRLYRLMKRERFSAVITFTHDANVLGMPAAWLAGVPVRVATHRGRILGYKRWQERLHAIMINLGLAGCLTAVSEETRRQAIEEGIRPERIRVIQNGVDLPGLLSAQECAEVRGDLGLAPDAVVILSAGRLTEEKGHCYLVQALPEVVAETPQVVLLLAGDGPLHAALEDEAQRLGVLDHIRFLGLREDVYRLMNCSDVFVLPSLSEGMPNALLEAMGMGTAVVSSDVGGVKEIIQDGQNGLLVPPAAPEAISRAVVRLLKNPVECALLAARGQKLVREQYTLDRMCEKYAELLDPAGWAPPKEKVRI